MALEQRLALEAQIRAIQDRPAILARIAEIGTATKANLPDKGAVAKLGPTVSGLVDRIRSLATSAESAHEWDDHDLAIFATEAAGLRSTAHVFTLFSQAGDGGTQGQPVSCATACRQEYDSCINSECGSGDDQGAICLCCAPCSLAYGGCMAKCIVRMVSQSGRLVVSLPDQHQVFRR
jgi:hypothetical protein